LKIVHVLTSLEIGGMETMVLALSLFQKQQGHQVAIATIYAEGDLFEKAKDAGIGVFFVGKRPGQDSWLTTKLLSKFIRAQHADVVHTHNLVPHYFAAAACWFQNKAVLINTRHDMGEHLSSKKGDILYRLAMRRSAAWVAVCVAAKRRFIDSGVIPEQKGRVVVNGLDLTAYGPRNSAQKNLLLLELGIEGAPLLFGSVGRINKVKDHQTMISAFELFVQTEPNAILVIVGDGPNLPTVKQQASQSQASNKIFFTGQRSDVANLMQGFDVFLQSSLTEGYSLALVEACATALPIIATNVGGNGEIINNSVTGFLVSSQAVDDFANAMRVLSSDKLLRESFGEKAREWCLANGSIASMYAEYDQIYRANN
jgi:glycosyltransferase involved in cell wall biosynthesis